MGCDIHIFAEIKIGDEWQKLGKMFEYEYAKRDQPVIDYYYTEEDGGSYQSNEWLTDQPYGGRNYDLFALLADVRNGSGFAGCDTGDAVVPISPPKGLPTDVSPAVKYLSEEYGGDGHSHTWLGLNEILNIDRAQRKTKRGWVCPKQYKIFKEKGSPDGWSGGVGGGNVVHITNEEMDAFIADDKLIGSEMSYYTQVEWNTTAEDCLKYFLECLEPLSKFGEPEEFRLVFWFDN